MFAILNRIKNSCPKLVSSHHRFTGKVRVPVECAVVLSNITREEFCSTKLPAVLPPDKTLFADDLALVLAQAYDQKSSQQTRYVLAEMFPPRFSFHLSSDDVAALRDVLWPHVRISLPRRSAADFLPEHEDEEILRMDAQQESLARRLDAADAIIQGPGGSGKTLVLAHKAVQVLLRLRSSGSDLPILFICFNLTLVHYLKRLVAAQRAPLGKNSILVTHFYDFCRSLLVEPLAYENEDLAYYKLVVHMALEAAPDSKKFGAIFVDEGQDFSDNMMDVLQAVRAENSLFWVACDDAQELYTTSQDWRFNPRFKKFILRDSYRASQNLLRFCKAIAPQDKTDGSPPKMPEPFLVKTTAGQKPILKQVHDMSEAASYIISRIQALYSQRIPYSEMMLLCATNKHPSAPNTLLPEFLVEQLEENGILVSWVSQNAQSKTSWDITTDKVSLSTIHSMKGLDAKAVFILGLDSLEADGLPDTQQRMLAYVACTRAREYLDIVFCKNPLIQYFPNGIFGKPLK
ncbi:nuclease-related domain-containing DEAD/DEAH box helicase [Desulfovibrionales bacterium]